MGSRHRVRHGTAATATSAMVVVVTIGFLAYALGFRHQSGGGQEYSATFLSSNGLKIGADAMLSGVAVGRVTAISLDTASMTSHVRFVVPDGFRLPVDTRLSIGSSTLTSSSALMIAPGTSSRSLAAGATLTDTCAPVSLEQAVSQYIFGSGGATSPCDG